MRITESTGKATRSKGKPRSLEALAFYLGAHKIDPDTVAAEIEAGFDADVAEEKQKVQARLRTLEANVEEVRRKLPEAELVWERVRAELGDTPPPAAEAIAMGVFALFSLALDAIFIAPSMDLMNVTDEAWQFVAGAGLAVLCTLFFHMTGSVLVARKSTRLMKSIAATVGACGILALVVWGLLRGYQLGFSAMLGGNPLGQFLTDHPVLTSIFYTFVTVATPLVGAASSIHAWRSVRAAHEWRRAHDTRESLQAQEVQLSKQVQKAEDELAHLETLADAHRREWNAILAQFYHRGMTHGARQETLVSVIRKCAFASFCTAPVFLLAAVVPVVTLAACPVIAGIGVFTWLNHRRVHPSHERYLKQENTQFAVPDRSFVQTVPPPSNRRLTKGDSE
jgi:hypothetical protein